MSDSAFWILLGGMVVLTAIWIPADIREQRERQCAAIQEWRESGGVESREDHGYWREYCE